VVGMLCRFDVVEKAAIDDRLTSLGDRRQQPRGARGIRAGPPGRAQLCRNCCSSNPPVHGSRDSTADSTGADTSARSVTSPPGGCGRSAARRRRTTTSMTKCARGVHQRCDVLPPGRGDGDRRQGADPGAVASHQYETSSSRGRRHGAACARIGGTRGIGLRGSPHTEEDVRRAATAIHRVCGVTTSPVN
jgi:hypothetical protein